MRAGGRWDVSVRDAIAEALWNALRPLPERPGGPAASGAQGGDGAIVTLPLSLVVAAKPCGPLARRTDVKLDNAGVSGPPSNAAGITASRAALSTSEDTPK